MSSQARRQERTGFRITRPWVITLIVLDVLAIGIILIAATVGNQLLAEISTGSLGASFPVVTQGNGPGTINAQHAREDAQLYSYGWVDKNAGIAHIPIQRAIELTAQKGLPSRQAPAQPAKDDGVTLPSYPSSGTQATTALH
jgi:hypothetical protein